jgi:EmrB/QacA subfamily drug resistance transporter
VRGAARRRRGGHAAAEPGRLERGVLLVGLIVVLGSAMSNLDATVVNVALKDLAISFGAPLPTIQWVVTGYTLALAVTIPLSAWAIGRFGTKAVYIASIALFTLGSVLAGVAWSAESLIAFRVVQGLGGGMIMPTGMTLMARAAGGRSGRVMSIVGVPMLLLPLSGPVLGGWLLDAASWRWIFAINVPVGALAIALALKVLRPEATRPARLDVAGLLLLSPGVACLLYGLARGATDGDPGAPAALLPTLAGALLAAGFVRHALHAAEPLIDLRLLRDRTVLAATAALALFAAGLLGAMLLMPLYFQLVRHESALHAGLLATPQGVGAALTMPIGGRLVDRMAPGRVLLAGLALASAGLLAFTVRLGASTSYWALGAGQLVMGMGMGMTMMPAMTAALRAVRPHEIPAVSAMLNIVQRVASSAGTALVSVLLATATSGRLALAAAGGGHAAGAFRHSFGWAGALLLAAFVPALLLPRRRAAPAAPVAAEAPGR